MTIKAFKIPSLFEVRFFGRAGGCERLHIHAALIISAVASGQIQLQVGEEEICLRPGMVAAVGTHVLHCARSFSTDFSGAYVLGVYGLPLHFKGFDVTALQGVGRLFLHHLQYIVIECMKKLIKKEVLNNINSVVF